jgi:hypothetical protein
MLEGLCKLQVCLFLLESLIVGNLLDSNIGLKVVLDLVSAWNVLSVTDIVTLNSVW